MSASQVRAAFVIKPEVVVTFAPNGTLDCTRTPLLPPSTIFSSICSFSKDSPATIIFGLMATNTDAAQAVIGHVFLGPSGEVDCHHDSQHSLRPLGSLLLGRWWSFCSVLSQISTMAHDIYGGNDQAEELFTAKLMAETTRKTKLRALYSNEACTFLAGIDTR